MKSHSIILRKSFLLIVLVQESRREKIAQVDRDDNAGASNTSRIWPGGLDARVHRLQILPVFTAESAAAPQPQSCAAQRHTTSLGSSCHGPGCELEENKPPCQASFLDRGSPASAILVWIQIPNSVVASAMVYEYCFRSDL